ncbi:MAG: methylenetetrahydrofolate reductase [Oscillospiraceae bacterium]|jgi:methylenetetrahydrofolate reductase (NADPH)|nr:methylenetetrahydrofolate reductase [Oscillospiraceae bacterium]
MKISEILAKGKVTVSCELFPPKHGDMLGDAKETVRQTARLGPSFISVTYGAGGGTGRHTASLAEEAQNVCGVTALAHLTCVSSSRETVRGALTEFKSRGIENILALRGDIPPGEQFPAAGQYSHASELMREIRDFGGFCVGGACYPEGHPESESLQKDLDSLKIKVESGCEFLTTQMFFDNNILYGFLYRLLRAGIDVPIVAGIMPVTDARQISRIIKLSNTALPARFRAITDRFSDNPAAMSQAGVAYATEQIIDLIANGVEHIHIYTMNKPAIAGGIMGNISEIFR